MQEVDHCAWALPHIARLEELRLITLDDWFGSEQALGKHNEVIGPLEAAVTNNPLHERLWGRLMVAYYRSGRQADALRTYTRLRTQLGEELGIEPGPELRQLEAAVLAQDSSLLEPQFAWSGSAKAISGQDLTAHSQASSVRPISSADFPLPSRLAVPPLVGVIGRDVELEQLSQAFKRVASGEGSELLLISGEAGAGKTTVASEFARFADKQRAYVLFGHCEEELRAPYQLFREALHHLVVHAPAELLESHVQSHGGEVVRLAPAVGQRVAELPSPQSTDPDTERYLLFGSVLSLFAQVSLGQPLVVVFDDLQWSDGPSLNLLRHIAANAGPMRLMVVGTYRGSRLSGSDPLMETLAALRRERGVTRIELRGLDDLGVLNLLEAMAGHRLDGDGVDLAHVVYRETDGNPFFVGELLRHLTDTGAVSQDSAGRWTASGALEELSLPESVREVIGTRVGRLRPGAERALSVAAVIGRDFDIDFLAHATGSPEDELIEICEEAESVALVRELQDAPGRYSFSHALIQHTLIENFGPTRLAMAHRSVAEALEQICEGRPGSRVGELAEHWFQATRPTDLSKALDYSHQAAEAALAALAPDEAARYFSQALQLLEQGYEPDSIFQVDLLIGLGTAQRQVGLPAFRDTLLDAAHQAQALGATDRLVAAALANNRGLFTSLGVVDDEKVRVLEFVLETMPADDSNERALLLATLCNELTHGRPLEVRRSLANQAKDMAQRLADPATIVQVLNLVEQPLEAPPTLDERVADTSEALRLAEALGDPYHLYFAAVYRRISSLQATDVHLATECLDVMRALTERLRQPILMWITKFHEAADALVAGDPDQAEALTTEALEIGTECGQPDAVSFYGTQLMFVRHQQGRLGELVPIIATVAAETSIPAYQGGLAAAYADAGQQSEALALLDSATEDGFTAMPMGIGWLDGMITYAEAAIELRAARPAALMYDLLAPYHAQVGFNGLIPLEPVALYLGALASVLGRYEEAEPYFFEAAECSARMGTVFPTTRTDLLWGGMLVERGAHDDADRARDLLTRASATATAQGYAKVERSAGYALRRLG